MPYRSRRAHRPAHPRVSPGRLRRCRRARRVPRTGAARAGGRRRALLRRTASERRRTRTPTTHRVAGRREPCAADARRRPVDGRRRSAGVDLAHSHTWYANMAGHLAKVLHGVPHVVTAHSLEPRRPWKAEQLGGGYRLSSWVERTAYEAADAVIAVSAGHARSDVLDCYPALDPARVHVVHNGIDTAFYHPDSGARRGARGGCRPRPPERGLRRTDHPAEGPRPPGRGGAPDRPGRAGRALRRCAGHPGDRRGDREGGRTSCSAARPGVVWVRGMLPTADIRQLLSAATVFVCPSVYEPLGIVNLEAMACGTAVVASDVGGIPEVVADGETGLLVHYDEHAVDAFRSGLADSVNALLADPARADADGRGRPGARRARVRLEAGGGPDRGDLPHAAPDRRRGPGRGPGGRPPRNGWRRRTSSSGAPRCGRCRRTPARSPSAAQRPCRSTPYSDTSIASANAVVARTRSTRPASGRRVVQVPAPRRRGRSGAARPARRPAAR